MRTRVFLGVRVGVRSAGKAALAVLLSFMLMIGALPLNVSRADGITPKIISMQLPTGQMLYIKEDHSKPIVTIDTWVKTGSVNETAEINGVSHFLEHLLFKGSEKYGPGEFDRILESRGAEFNAATSDDFTHYYITTATPYFEEALALHAEMLLNAAIPDSELPQERKVVQEEINRANDNPDRQLYVALSRLMYGEHGYAQDTLGPKEVITNVPRDAILDYYHYWYQPRNFNTVIVGDVNADEVKRLVAQHFPAPPFAQPKHYRPPQVGPVSPPRAIQVDVSQNPNISQVYMALGMLGPAMQNPDDVYAMDIAMLSLGSGKSSRLYQALREQKPLATNVYAANYTQQYSGLLLVGAQAQPENREAVKRELIAQLQALKARGITQAELDKAKTQYLKDFIFQNETTRGTASSIGYNVTIGTLDDYLSHVRNVEAVTLERVQDALNRYIDFDRAVMVELLPSKLQANLAEERNRNLALLRTAGATPVQVGGTAEAAPAEAAVSKRVLNNGMTFLSKPLPDSATVAVKLFVKGGQGVEALPGVSSLTGSLLMQGTRNRTAEQISRELESKGMNLSVSADEDYLEITGTAVQADMGELFAVMKDVLRNPVFAEAEIAKKKQQMMQAIAASRDNPSSVTFENLSMALYPDHPYGNDGKRIEQHLDRISRQQLLDYYHLYFRPENMVAVAVGNFDPETVGSYLESLYERCQNCPPRPGVTIPPVKPLAQSRTVAEPLPQLSAVWLAQGWLAPPVDHPDYVPLKVLNSLVGTGMSSRLFTELRDKQGLAYVVGSMYPSRAQDSRFVIHIGTDPVNTERVQAGFKQEVARLKNEPVPAAELNEAKSKLIGSFALAHDTNTSQAYYLGFFETLGMGYQYDETYPSLVDKVTPEDIQRVARKYFAGPSVISLVKPAAASSSAGEP